MFLILNHPLSLGITLITQTLLITLLSGTLSINFWFSYSLFLIFIGGILILFIYITSLASNEIFKFSFNSIHFIFFLLFLFFRTLIFFLMDHKNFLLNLIKNQDSVRIITLKNLALLNNLMLHKIFNFPVNIISILLVNYLFLTLIARVKITNIFKGPLRPSV